MKILIFTGLILLFINLINADYKSLGIDATAKQEIEEKIAKESQLPVINISTKNNSEKINYESYVESIVDVFNVEDKLKLKERSERVKIRGNSTGYYGIPELMLNNTVPYKIKFDKKTNLLGLHNGEKFKEWVLLKSEDDVIKNDITFRMVDERKVNVTQPEKNYNGTDIGYYIEIDNYYDLNPGRYYIYDFDGLSAKDIRGEERQFAQAEFVLKSDFYCQEQLDFIGNYTVKVFNIIYQAVKKGEYKTFDENYNLVNSTFISAEETISAVVDIESFTNMYLLYEIVHDYDVGEGSFYFAIDFSENSKIRKFQMVSPWDFNWTYFDSPKRYWAATFSELEFANRFGDRSNPWFILLEKQYIDENKDDFSLVGDKVFDNIEEVRNWIVRRFDWMDEAFVSGKSVMLIPSEEETVGDEPTEVETTEQINIDSDDEIEVTASYDEEEDSTDECSSEEEK
ncbi:hypothetical protein BCR36DRAFT_415508 [Piromyces finnis]|uniref:Coth-domain-containing protein n=1 Tax=Piromyces finnis TaxID=1754191 RepID=A0A1Y1UYS0_9FUNG|nr:hypothetical protein BCR36DRAFT_415508 [Piromyces finnis]|eukprot:ORX43666.1 hypothetical protein BCR36DRAFT_415508 [Piromyces finnis]